MYIDSNIFIYAAIDNTEKGNKARKVIDKIANGEIKAYISPLVIDEVMWVIQKMVNRETAHQVGNLIISLSLNGYPFNCCWWNGSLPYGY